MSSDMEAVRESWRQAAHKQAQERIKRGDVRLNVHLLHDQGVLVKTAAADMGLSPTQLVRRVVQTWLADGMPMPLPDDQPTPPPFAPKPFKPKPMAAPADVALPAEPTPQPLPKAPAAPRVAKKAVPAAPVQHRRLPNTLHQRAHRESLEDAANRHPVLVRFTKKHDYVPHGMRQMLADNGLRKRGLFEWVGWLRPAAIESLGEKVPRHNGQMHITGALGEALLKPGQDVPLRPAVYGDKAEHAPGTE